MYAALGGHFQENGHQVPSTLEEFQWRINHLVHRDKVGTMLSSAFSNNKVNAGNLGGGSTLLTTGSLENCGTESCPAVPPGSWRGSSVSLLHLSPSLVPCAFPRVCRTLRLQQQIAGLLLAAGPFFFFTAVCGNVFSVKALRAQGPSGINMPAYFNPRNDGSTQMPSV